ncbi:DUF4238 domain-containing protein [Kitasatospora cineracea]|uniref:Uncharacterized protein DUF4238 n=1 Tax=Kitasatospora cineracea TaxID=88074 RepID=A0A8G1XEN8_9ACTN|nr:DUF4238 domain-containing protein [Kitasatospora cineracea]ROR42967.1 uncharacterized protein DUF4238 [Kitasatospora cineracea]
MPGPTSQEHPKRHHTVARLQQSGFCNEHDQVLCVPLPGGRSFLQNINDATVIGQFNRVTRDGEDSYALEYLLSDLETDCAPAWKRARDPRQWPLSASDRRAVATLIAAQHLRTMRSRAQILNTHNLLLELAEKFGLPYEAQGEPNLPLEHARLINSALPQARDVLVNRSWMLFVFKRKALAFSDSPVVPVPGVDSDWRTPAGLFTEGGVLVPLARRVALVVGAPGTSPSVDAMVEGTTKRATDLNSLISANAHRFLYHHPEDDPLRGISLPEPGGNAEVMYEVMTHAQMRQHLERTSAAGQQ